MYFISSHVTLPKYFILDTVIAISVHKYFITECHGYFNGPNTINTAKKYLMYKVQMTNDAHNTLPSASNAIKNPLSTDNTELTNKLGI